MHALAGLWHALPPVPVQAAAFGSATLAAMTGVGVLLGWYLARR